MPNFEKNFDSLKCLDHLNDVQRTYVSDFVRDIGDNARNQLARPCEYLAQTKHVISKLFEMFPNTGWCNQTHTEESLKNKTTTNRSNVFKEGYFCTVFPELELFYNDDPSSDSFEIFFYICFCGTPPEESLWKTTFKLEHLNVTFEKMENFDFFDLTVHPKNPYQFSVRPPPEDISGYFGVSEKGWKTFSESDFDAAYFCNAKSNFLGYSSKNTAVYPPGLSDHLEYSVGNDEMLRKYGTANDLPDPTPYRFDSKDSYFLESISVPTAETISRMVTPFGTTILINGQMFRNSNKQKLEALLRVPDGRKVGYNKLSKMIVPYRIVLKCGCDPHHNLDHVSELFDFLKSESFEKYVSEKYPKPPGRETVEPPKDPENFMKMVFTPSELEEINAKRMNIPTTYSQMTKNKISEKLDEFRKNSVRKYGKQPKPKRRKTCGTSTKSRTLRPKQKSKSKKTDDVSNTQSTLMQFLQYK